MEYGEAITARNFERAVALARKELGLHPDWSLEKVAADGVCQAYCACVIAANGAAQNRISDMHRVLAERVRSRLSGCRWSPPSCPGRLAVKGATNDLSAMW